MGGNLASILMSLAGIHKRLDASWAIWDQTSLGSHRLAGPRDRARLGAGDPAGSRNEETTLPTLGNGGPFKYDHAPTHFLDIERSEAGPLCATEGDAVSDDLTTVLVERITCENCRGAINRHLASNRIQTELEHKHGRRGDRHPKLPSLGEE
jgi:hypothetical protein